MTFAIVETGGKQHKVVKDEIILVEKLEAPEKKDIKLDRVLLVSDGKKIDIGAPYLKGAHVTCELLKQERGPKVIAYKYKRRKSSKFTKGHRQNLTRLKVKEIHV